MTNKGTEQAANAIAQTGQRSTGIEGLLKNDKAIAALRAALPETMSPKRVAQIATTEVRKNPALANVDPISLFGCILQSAQLGLELGGALGQAYLVPFRSKTGADAQFILGYRGMIDLARRSGEIISLQSHEVREGDEFEFAFGLNEKLDHIPNPDHNSRGDIIAFYAIAKLQGGGHQIEVMSRDEVEEVRKQSKAGNSGPWVTHFAEMGKKTVIRRLFKYLPVSVTVQRAVALDEQADAGVQNNADWIDLDADDFKVRDRVKQGV